MKYLTGVEIKGAGFTCISGEGEATVFIEDIENSTKNVSFSPWIAHELVHVLQIISERHAMKFENEQEHFAYLMHYMMNELIAPTPKSK